MTVIPEIKTISKRGLQFIADEEGCVLHPYYDSAGIASIGYGMTYYPPDRKVKITDPPITKSEALIMFNYVLRTYEKAVWSMTRDDINQNNFDSLVSLCYNIGVNAFRGSTVLKRVNADPHDVSIREAFLMWKNAGGKPILLGRRSRESALYFRPV